MTIIEISTHRFDDKINREELALFTLEALQGFPTNSDIERTIETTGQYLQGILDAGYADIILARSENQLLGWLCLYPSTSTMIYIEQWHPIIKQSEEEDNIATKLIAEAIEYTKRSGRKRLEVFHMGLTEERRPWYERYGKWYVSAGMSKGGEWAYMVCDLKNIQLDEVEIPKGFDAAPIYSRSNDEIYECYEKSFKASMDGRFLDQTDEDRRSNFDEDFFDRSKPIVEDASLLLLKNDSIVGFLKLHPMRDGGFVTGYGIDPDYRRRGLGKALMKMSLRGAAKQGLSEYILEVDVENKQAIELYEAVGFEKKHGSISHVWKDIQNV
ncbi:MAG: GNAT family N-acetyltransferase [Candidatus Thorarchaeota archaeon]